MYELLQRKKEENKNRGAVFQKKVLDKYESKVTAHGRMNTNVVSQLSLKAINVENSPGFLKNHIASSAFDARDKSISRLANDSDINDNTVIVGDKTTLDNFNLDVVKQYNAKGNDAYKFWAKVNVPLLVDVSMVKKGQNSYEEGVDKFTWREWENGAVEVKMDISDGDQNNGDYKGLIFHLGGIDFRTGSEKNSGTVVINKLEA